MPLPHGFTCSTPGKVCRLQKSLYSPRQAPRQWFAKLSPNYVNMVLFIHLQTNPYSLRARHHLYGFACLCS